MDKKKKIFVYDGSSAFSRFIRIKYENEVNVDVCKRVSKFTEKFTDDYLFALVVINNEDDLIVFSYLYAKVNFVFVVTNMVDVNFVLSKFNNVLILDMKKTKQETFDTINFHLAKNNIDWSFINY